jgi:cell division protein ZapA
MDKKIVCNIVIGTEYFTLNPTTEFDEEIVRKAANLINEKMQYYQQKNSIKSTQRLLALSALDFVMSNLKSDLHYEDFHDSVSEKLLGLEKTVDSVIETQF